VRALHTRGYTPIVITAALSLAVLSVAVAWEWSVRARKNDAPPPTMPIPIERTTVANDAWLEELFASGVIATTTENTTPLPTPGTFTETVLGQLVDSYVSLQEGASGDSPDSLAFRIAENARVPITYTEVSPEDIPTDSDTSYERMLEYRNDLRVATEPLLVNNEAEFAIFARYVETGDRGYLNDLRLIASRYKEAGALTQAITPPKDALLYHVNIVNALNEFAAVLDAMGRFADDPVASIAVLRAYNEAERHMFVSFNALSTYYASKQP
jgi:hypothetical protein